MISKVINARKTLDLSFSHLCITVTTKQKKQEHAMAMVKYAFRMLFELERIKTEEDLKFEMRIGLHTGPCIGGVIGRLKPR